MRHMTFENVANWSALVVASVAVGAIGCGGFSGEEGTIYFEYSSDAFQEKSPLAVDGTAELRAFVDQSPSTSSETSTSNGASSGTSSSGAKRPDPVDLTNVRSRSPSIIEVVSIQTSDENAFRLKAKKSGEAVIEVEGTSPAGAQLSDRLTLESAEAASVELSHECGDVSDPVYLTNQTVGIGRTFKDADGRTIVGWGYQPFELSRTSGGATLTVLEELSVLGVETGSEAEPVTVQPTIDGSPLELSLRPESAITAMNWYGLDGSFDQTPTWIGDPESEQGAFIFPAFEVEGRSVCDSKVELSLDNQSPDVCEVGTKDFGPNRDIVDEIVPVGRAINIKLKSNAPSQTCTIEVNAPNASGSVRQTVEIDFS